MRRFYGNDISAVNDQVAWAAIADSHTDTEGGILHTADGGGIWTIQSLPSGMNSRHIKGIKGVSSSEAWAVSLGSEPWRRCVAHDGRGHHLADCAGV